MDTTRVRSLLLRVAILVALVVGLTPPSLFFYQGLAAVRAASVATSHAHSVSVTRVISRSPETWRYQENLLREILALRSGEMEGAAVNEAIRVLALDGSTIIATADLPAAPRVSHRSELNDSGKVVGHVEFAVGLRPLLERTGLVVLLGIVLGGLVFAVLRFLPLRAVDTVLGALQAEVRRAEAALADKARVESVLRENEENVLRRAQGDRLLESLAAAANSARTPGEALAACLKRLCEFTGWPLGHAALIDLKGDWAETRMDYWHGADEERYRRVVEVTSGYRYPVREGQFCGKVIRTRAPVWIRDLSSSAFQRYESFAGSGLMSGIGFPILRGEEVIGIFEFYAPTAMDFDTGTAELIERAGVHIGRVAERAAANEEVLRLNAELEQRVAERGAQMERANATLAAQGRQAAMLGEMTGVLQIAENLNETGMLVERYLPVALDGVCNGALYLARASRDYLERVAQWGEFSDGDSGVGVEQFPPVQCWAMRRGQPHGSIDGSVHLECPHVAGHDTPGGTLCLPLAAQGDTLGVLQIGFSEAGDEASRAERMSAAKRVAEQLSLALANVRLRDRLREQSIRDALTGLHNRRYLEETLIREMARARRERQDLSVFMLDVDHFKRYNDNHGHDAGDAVLRELGRTLRENSRGSDVVCRYGGEEFSVILPNTSGPDACTWAERLMESVRHMRIRVGNRALPPVSVSMGLAVFPLHGASIDIVLRAADAALYEAKRAGRDRMQVARLEAPGKPEAGIAGEEVGDTQAAGQAT